MAKTNIRKWKQNLVFYATCAILLASVSYAGTANKARQLVAGDKAKVTGTIVSRDGDLIRIREKGSGELVAVNITDKTKIQRKNHTVQFFRHTDMDVTAMVPGLTIQAEGVGNAKGHLNASTISFNPDEFALEVAQEPQVLAKRATAQNAQSTTNQGAGAVAMLKQRVSDLDDYKNKFEVDVFFARDSAVIDEAAKRDLANLADIAKSLDRYMIEIAGYSSNTLSKETDQKVSEERAAAVARYLLEVKDIPLRRILVPVGYGTTHPVASNSDPQGRELNRRVDVKILVNQSPR
jgi:outer membrane protein OmpA-like peptidoglycan-associated protein